MLHTRPDPAWFQSLKKGDRVAIVTYNYSSAMRVDFSEVHHITPKGTIVVGKDKNTDKFSSTNGRRIKDNSSDPYCRVNRYIEPITEELLNRKWAMKLYSIFSSAKMENYEKLSPEQITQLKNCAETMGIL